MTETMHYQTEKMLSRHSWSPASGNVGGCRCRCCTAWTGDSRRVLRNLDSLVATPASEFLPDSHSCGCCSRLDNTGILSVSASPRLVPTYIPKSCRRVRVATTDLSIRRAGPSRRGSAHDHSVYDATASEALSKKSLSKLLSSATLRKRVGGYHVLTVVG